MPSPRVSFSIRYEKLPCFERAEYTVSVAVSVARAVLFVGLVYIFKKSARRGATSLSLEALTSNSAGVSSTSFRLCWPSVSTESTYHLGVDFCREEEHAGSANRAHKRHKKALRAVIFEIPAGSLTKRVPAAAGALRVGVVELKTAAL